MPFVGELYDFQDEAVERMLEARKFLVAMDLGMGKTVIAIAACEELLDNDEASCVLILADKSITHQWVHMIDTFTGFKASVQVIDGANAKKRAVQYRDVIGEQFDYCIMSYSQVLNDWDTVRYLPADVIICDEVTRIKSFSAQRSKRVKKMRAPYKFGLTGQPIENHAEEVFSIMEWIDPKVLGDPYFFEAEFVRRNKRGWISGYKNLPRLHKRLAGSMIRKSRHDPDVREQYPAVVEESLLIDFDSAGAALYRHIAASCLTALEEAVDQWGGEFKVFSHYQGEDESMYQARGQIMSRLSCLNMLCCHPELLRISARNYNDDTQPHSGSVFAALLAETGRLDKVTKAPKLEATIDFIDEIMSADGANKMVLFSFYKPMLPLIRRAMDNHKRLKHVRSVRFHSGLNDGERDAVKQRFARDPATRLFLSNDCGGYGLDLPMANYLDSYDLPWSAGKWHQRNGRIIRLSSVFPEVTLMSSLMSDSVEERQYAIVQQKVGVGRAVIDRKGVDAKGNFDLDSHSLHTFLEESSV